MTVKSLTLLYNGLSTKEDTLDGIILDGMFYAFENVYPERDNNIMKTYKVNIEIWVRAEDEIHARNNVTLILNSVNETPKDFTVKEIGTAKEIK
jgi:hypothetical protein